MDNLEKYLDQVMEQKPAAYEPGPELIPEEEAEARPDLLKSIMRRWYIVVITTIVICAVGLPAIWLLVEPLHVVSGAVQVEPAESLLTGAATNDGRQTLFINTEADKLLSNSTLHGRIASSLVDRNLAFFSSEPQTLLEKLKAKIMPGSMRVDMVQKIREAINDGKITVSPRRDTNLLVVTMKGPDAEEAKVIVSAFLTTYQSRYTTTSQDEDLRDRTQLEDQRDKLLADMKNQRDKIREAGEEFGSTFLDNLHEIELGQQARLRDELTSLQSEESRLRASLVRLDVNSVEMSAEQRVAARQQHVNSDPDMIDLTAQIGEQKRALIELRVSRKEGSGQLMTQEAILADLEQARDERRMELEQEFDAGLEENLRMLAAQQRAAAQAQLDEVQGAMAALEQQLAEQEAKVLAIGRKNLEIQDLQDELNVMRNMFETVSSRLRQIDVDGQGRRRVTDAWEAQEASEEDKRVKYTAAVAFLALGCGFGLALLRDKMDKTLQSADDLTRQLDVPVLGTTSSSSTVKPSMFAEQIAADYQTIRTNLGLLTNGGMPRKLAISSPGMREGKTTFAVNLATSLAKGGKRVLLIDGDLRKPDVRRMLNITNGAGTVQDVLMGTRAEQAICTVPASGLHVLVAHARKMADAYELLASSKAAERIERLGREYDHVIIDTPPVLAFPDALIWAKLAGAVVLVGFAGTTTGPDLREAKEKLARVRVQVLGAILSNVRAEPSLYRYGYGYRAADAETMRQSRRQRKGLLSAQNADDTAKPRSG